MKKLHYETVINATREEVWDAVTNDRKYREWTSAFHPTSHFVGSWKEGDTIRFIAINDKNEKEGMVSQIAKADYPSYLSIKHLGMVSNGVDDTTSEEVKKWAPSFENYTLEKVDDKTTRFSVDMDAADEWAEMFDDMWPRALKKLKEVSEGGVASKA